CARVDHLRCSDLHLDELPRTHRRTPHAAHEPRTGRSAAPVRTRNLYTAPRGSHHARRGTPGRRRAAAHSRSTGVARERRNGGTGARPGIAPGGSEGARERLTRPCASAPGSGYLSNVEPEQHHIPILHDVLLPLTTYHTLLLRTLPAAVRDEILVARGLRA